VGIRTKVPVVLNENATVLLCEDGGFHLSETKNKKNEDKGISDAYGGML
jgi:hypothetical protein